MQKLLYTLLLIIFVGLLNVSAQKKFINRKVAQKNYEGYLLLQEKKYAEALTYFNEAISEDPEASFIYQNRAICRLELNDTTGAISDFKTNIRLEPENTESKYALGNIYKKQADSINASIWFEQAIAQSDDEFSQTKLLYMNNFLGNYYRAAEKYDSAVICYNRVKTYDPQNSSVFINSAVCYFQLDSLDRFCNDLERAFVLGGNVNCIALKSYCNGCSHLIDERGGKVDTLSMVLDTRLRKIIPDTVFLQHFRTGPDNLVLARKEVKVYFNNKWQVCLPRQASFYRQSFWQVRANYFVDNFTDYYVSGEKFAEGQISANKLNDTFKMFYPNGNIKIDGKFANGMPVGKWQWFLENGQADYSITFNFDSYVFKVDNEKNQNFPVNSGSGKIRLLIDQWSGTTIELIGELQNNQKSGKWEYKRNNETLISEVYKNGEFKRGFILSTFGKIEISSPYMDGSYLTPAYLMEAEKLYIVSQEAADYYPFINVVEFKLE